jgi:hypothetical protein
MSGPGTCASQTACAVAAGLAHAEWLALLLDREAANRNTRRFQIRLRSAKLRHGQAAIEDAQTLQDACKPMHTDPSTIWVICYQRTTQERRPSR